MPFPLGHLAGSYFFTSKWHKKMADLSWMLLFIGAILPDIDFGLFKLFGLYHRTFTHSLVFLVLVAGIIFLFLKFFKKSTRPAFFLAIGIFTHLVLDSLQYPGVQLLWPFEAWISAGGFNFLQDLSFLESGIIGSGNILFDLAVGLIWAIFLLIKRIRRYLLESD